MSKTVIELQNIRRDFQVGEETVHALRGISFPLPKESSSPSWARPVPVNRHC